MVTITVEENMKKLILAVAALLAATLISGTASAAPAGYAKAFQTSSNAVQVHYGCGRCAHRRGCGGCRAYRYTVQPACGRCGGCGLYTYNTPYYTGCGYGYSNYGCGCGGGHGCGCGYGYGGCGFGGCNYGYNPCGYGGCGYYGGGWSPFGWLF